MAQGAIASVLPTNGVTMISPEELHEILEYEKIIKFRDDVFAGIHPTVKLPAHFAAIQTNTARQEISPSSSTARIDAPAQRPSAPCDVQSLGSNNKSPNNSRNGTGGFGQMGSRSEINPILLEKSDDLIKAEIQLQRQRLERSLREQIEHQRVLAKAMYQTSESLPDFDLAEVLSKALAIVHPSTSTDLEQSVEPSASDSFDDNTFYSSQHDTPELASPLQGQREAVTEKQSHGLVPYNKTSAGVYNTQAQGRDQDVVMTGALLSVNNYTATQDHPHAHEVPAQQNDHSTVSEKRHGNSDRGSSTEQNSNSARQQAVRIINHVQNQNTTKSVLQHPFDQDAVSPLVRAHNLFPFAPQAARVSPLATSRDPPIIRESHLVEDIPPAQVTALRQAQSGNSSTNSSPRRLNRSEMRAENKAAKKEKSKKRKSAMNDNGDRPDSPYIKPEPGSPSPFAVVPLPRPNKRQRQYAAELNYDEPAEQVRERVSERYNDGPAMGIYEERYVAEPRRPGPIYQRIEPEAGRYRRVSSGVQYAEESDYHRVANNEHYSRQIDSPSSSTVPYAQGEMRPVRATSRAVVDRRFHEEPIYYRDPVSRASVRPETNREQSRSPVIHERRSPILMGPPRRPVRIVIDEHGREYIDPTPLPVMRQSVAPQPRYRDQEIIYERAPLRSVSSRAPMDTFEEDGVIYRKQTPPLTAPRRVVTQPEYAMPPEYRSYRQREYSVRPMGPPGEAPTRAPAGGQLSHLEEGPREYMSRAPSIRPEPPARSQYEEAPREYINRAPSVRPTEPIRYEIPREHVGRLQSVRPEAPPREYAASVRPEAYREVLTRPPREYSVRPDHYMQREPVSTMEGYYEEVPRARPTEVIYERPRAREASVVVYTDDARREVYR